MFNNSKYGNLLTIILIIAIVAILGIAILVGTKIYKAYHTDSDAIDAANAFEQATVNKPNNNTTKNENKTDISGINESATDGNSSSTEGGNNGTKTKYKGFDVIGTIQIPKISLKYPILEKLSPKSLETSVVLLYTANGLNQVGNSVIIGHNYRNGTMFSNVKKLEKGDLIYITDVSGTKVKYKIYDIYRASGSEGNYMTRNTDGKREISLSTCTDDSKARTIVLAKEA